MTTKDVLQDSVLAHRRDPDLHLLGTSLGGVGDDVGEYLVDAAHVDFRTGRVAAEAQPEVKHWTPPVQEARALLPEERLRVAVHESGHALVAHLHPGEASTVCVDRTYCVGPLSRHRPLARVLFRTAPARLTATAGISGI